MKIKELVIAGAALVLLGAVAFVWLAPGGSRAPDVTVTTLDGREVRLAELRGKPLLVTFWATSCPGCIAEMPHLTELHHEMAKKGLTILGVAMDYDDPRAIREMVRQREVPYLIAWDEDGAAARAFGDVKLTPTSFLIDAEGRIVQQKLGEMDMQRLHQRLERMLGEAA